MEYKEKPFSYKMNFLNLNPNYKYLGGIGERKNEYKRVVDEENSIFEDESIRKKTKNSINVESTVFNAIDDFHKTRLSLLKDKDITKPLEKIEEEKIPLQNDSIIQKTNNQIGKISGITKK